MSERYDVRVTIVHRRDCSGHTIQCLNRVVLATCSGRRFACLNRVVQVTVVDPPDERGDCHGQHTLLATCRDPPEGSSDTLS